MISVYWKQGIYKLSFGLEVCLETTVGGQPLFKLLFTRVEKRNVMITNSNIMVIGGGGINFGARSWRRDCYGSDRDKLEALRLMAEL